MPKKTAFAIAFAIIFCITSSAQEDKNKRPSPPAQARCEFADGKTITVNYSSPRARGRKVFGELVPYGAVWRTGANEATTFLTNENLTTVKGTNIPPGSYTIFTVPAANAWTLIINRHTGQPGMPYTYESEELARVPMSVSKLSTPVENFTISFDPMGGSCTLRLAWETTQASVEFAERNTDTPLKPQ
jgi:hypothetical protein